MFTFASCCADWRGICRADSGAHFAGAARRDGADCQRFCWKVSRGQTGRPWRCLHGRGRGANSGTDARRLDHGQLLVALDFLHQPAVGILAVLMQQWLVEDRPTSNETRRRRLISSGSRCCRLAGDAANHARQDRKRTGLGQTGSGGWWQFRPSP